MTNPSATSSMLAINSVWGAQKTFRLLPMDINCPYMECIYDPGTKILVVISKLHKQSYHMLPQLDDHGDAIPAKKVRPENKNIREERRLVDTYQEYYIVINEEMYDFLSRVCINYEKFDFKSYMESPVEVAQVQ